MGTGSLPLRWSHAGLRWALNPTSGLLIRREGTERRTRIRPREETQREGGRVAQRPAWCSLSECWPHPAREKQEGSSPRASGGSTAPGHLDFRFWPPELERVNSCCFKPPRLWSCLTAALGNEHTPTVNEEEALAPRCSPGVLPSPPSPSSCPLPTLHAPSVSPSPLLISLKNRQIFRLK